MISSGKNCEHGTPLYKACRKCMDSVAPAASQSDQPAQGERKQIEILRRWLFTVGIDEQSKRAEQLMALLKREGIVAAPSTQPVAPACMGYPECDGDLPGEPHEPKCPAYRYDVDGPLREQWEKTKAEAATVAPSSGADARELAEKILFSLTGRFSQHDPSGKGSPEVRMIVPLLESFRAEMLEQAAQFLDGQSEKVARLTAEGQKGLGTGTYEQNLADDLRRLSPSPNWLARQIAEAELEEAKQWHAILRKEVPHVEGDTNCICHR